MDSTPEKPRLRRALANFAAFAAGCALVVLLLGAMEGALRIKAGRERARANPPVFTNLDQYDYDTPLGRKHLPNVTLNDRVTRGGRVVYEAVYKIDAHSRRVTPCDSPETRGRVAAFFGCSFTFGSGCQDNETLPARFAARCPDYLPLNYACGGYGPQQTWLMLNRLGVLDDLPSQKGAVIFTFIENHLDRLVGAPGVLSVWAFPMPWLTLENGAIQWEGTFNDRLTLPSFWSLYAERLHLVKFVENRMPRRPQSPAPSAAAVALFAAAMQECSRAVAVKSPDLKFYCLIFPGTPRPCRDALAVAFRERSEVVLLDYGELLFGSPHADNELWFDDSPWAPYGHPRPPVYDLVAARLAQDIGGCS